MKNKANELLIGYNLADKENLIEEIGKIAKDKLVLFVKGK